MRILSPTEHSRKTAIWNLRKPLPVANDTVHAIYAGELLEHLVLDDARRLLRECYRALRPGGILRICVPDNYELWMRYCTVVMANLARPEEEWSDESSSRVVSLFFKDICVKRPILGSMGHFHKWAYDQISLILEFKRAGFVGVGRRKFWDSDIPGIEAVERSEFLIVEGRKPSQ
jgi:predicted SAM-dependent methyltransferase